MVHVTFGAIVFVTVFTIGWLVSLCFDSLNTMHQFSPQAYTLISRLEIWLFYMDCALSGFMFVLGCFKFVIHTLEDD